MRQSGSLDDAPRAMECGYSMAGNCKGHAVRYGESWDFRVKEARKRFADGGWKVTDIVVKRNGLEYSPDVPLTHTKRKGKIRYNWRFSHEQCSS